MNSNKHHFLLFPLISLVLAFTLAASRATAGPVQQPAADYAAVDAYVAAQMNRLGIPGMALGIIDMLSGKPAAPVAVPFLVHLLYWSLLLMPLLQILGILCVWRRRQRIGRWGTVLGVLLNLAVAIFVLILAQMEMTLPSLVYYNPELGYAALLAAVIGFVWSAVWPLMKLRRRPAALRFNEELIPAEI